MRSLKVKQSDNDLRQDRVELKCSISHNSIDTDEFSCKHSYIRSWIWYNFGLLFLCSLTNHSFIEQPRRAALVFSSVIAFFVILTVNFGDTGHTDLFPL